MREPSRSGVSAVEPAVNIRDVKYYAPVLHRLALAVFLSILSCGLFFLFTYVLRRHWWIRLACRRCRLIGSGDAQYAIVELVNGQIVVSGLQVSTQDGLLLVLERSLFQWENSFNRPKEAQSPINGTQSQLRQESTLGKVANLFTSKCVMPFIRIDSSYYAWRSDLGHFVEWQPPTTLDFPEDAIESAPLEATSAEADSRSVLVGGHDVLNKEEDDEMTLMAFRTLPRRKLFFYIGCVVTLGLLWLILYWKPAWRLRFTHQRCGILQADTLLLVDLYDRAFVRPIRHISKDGIAVVPLDAAAVATYFSGKTSTCSIMRYFTVQKLRYYWNAELKCFEKYQGLLGEDPTFSFFHNCKGLSPDESVTRRVLAGPNAIEVKITPVITIIVREILTPFYMFQIFSCCLWFVDEYVIFASTIVILSSCSMIWTTWLTRRNERALRKTVHAPAPVTVLRPDGSEEDIMPDELTPGDVIVIPRQGVIMQCDAVLQCGNCVVNESMLTGESVPVTKTPPPVIRTAIEDQVLHVKLHERHVLFCGTQVLQTKYFSNKSVRAVVISTGLMTAKGDLIRSIMFPKPLDFKFIVDAMKFVGLLACIAMFGLVYSLALRIVRGESPYTIIVRCLDLVTIVVPPALPIALSVGYATAQRRLKKSQIFCVSPSTINVCGVVDVVCFDKTGTLTEEGLDFAKILPVHRGEFQEPLQNCDSVDVHDPLLIGMATCHSLATIEGRLAGDPIDLKMFQVTGWELEEPTGPTNAYSDPRYDVVTPTIARPRRTAKAATAPEGEAEEIVVEDEATGMPYEVGILRQFPFSSSLQRMAVVTRALGEQHFAIFMKGAPETVVSLCQPHTVPDEFTSELVGYTQEGYRVLGLAYKPLPGMSYAKIQRLERQQLEHGLEFLGLLVLENRLKPQSAPVIAQLRDAHMRCLMVTGDNTLTALSVARDCGLIDDDDQVVIVNAQAPTIDYPEPRIEFVQTPDAASNRRVARLQQFSYGGGGSINEVDESAMAAVMVGGPSTFHFAMTGKAWAVVRDHFPELIPRLVVRGTVFARFTPTQKKQLIEALQDLGYFVAMCGDGANDCGALKTAHAGISLSETEASVASPFTSKHANIECVPTVIREGRAALVTSLGVFRFMVCYSLIQFMSTCLLYYIAANLSDYEFLYIDLFILTTVGFTFTLTDAYPRLVSERPPASLLDVQSVISLFVYVLINGAFQWFAFWLVTTQPWYHQLKKADINNKDFYCFENYAVFTISTFQYVSMAIVLSKGPPFRKNLFTNWPFVCNLAFIAAANVVITMLDDKTLSWVTESLAIMPPPDIEFRAGMLGLALLNFLICWTIEAAVVDAAWPGILARKLGSAFKRRFLKSRKAPQDGMAAPIKDTRSPSCASAVSKSGAAAGLRTPTMPTTVSVFATGGLTPSTVHQPLIPTNSDPVGLGPHKRPNAVQFATVEAPPSNQQYRPNGNCNKDSAITNKKPLTGTAPSAKPVATTSAARLAGVPGHKGSPRPTHAHVSRELASNPDWPPVRQIGDLRFLQEVFLATSASMPSFPPPSSASDNDGDDDDDDDEVDQSPILGRTAPVVCGSSVPIAVVNAREGDASGLETKVVTLEIEGTPPSNNSSNC